MLPFTDFTDSLIVVPEGRVCAFKMSDCSPIAIIKACQNKSTLGD